VEIKYKSVDGTIVSIETDENFGTVILEFEHEEALNNRAETRRHESLSNFDKDSKNADLSTDVCEEVFKTFEKDRLYDAISKLKLSEQNLIQKLYLCKNPISQAEYAKNLGIHEKSMQEKSRRVRRKLEKMLKN
jgi:DNA-directed RNA polymerase specialized sigma24 family protein